ncbi:hypothetical protein P6P90_04775 [Ectobacillus antri]|uniref:Uncharacterized protein n=1 Tax=Ectobacillus antri TaxID=2486280 RepID=A0ABT6H296_9BACI|nr:hypothetical protein [Ectobacillus antri]MDG4655551.1 hypothetical protein [Ectobacillus antri]MDG5753309.1 hypothetical protein [Ectobacillus antri]
MSVTNRRIVFYNLLFVRTEDNSQFFDKQLFIDIMNYISSTATFMLDIPRRNKAIGVEQIEIEHIDYKDCVKLIFKSCKYNHTPDYMSKLDGSVRNSDKKQHEGEKEITHLCATVNTAEAEVILEERRSGVTINEIVKFLNECVKEYIELRSEMVNFKLDYGLVPSSSFLTNLNKMQKVKVAEVFTHKRVLGSETMALLDREDEALKDDVVLTLKAKRGESLLKRNMQSLYESLAGENTVTTRVRIYGTDKNNKGIKLDSEYMKKTEFVTAKLNENGIVDSQDMLTKMLDMLGVNSNAIQI